MGQEIWAFIWDLDEGVKLMCEENWALIWDLEEGPIWGKLSIWDLDEGSVWEVKKIDLSFWDLDGLVPSLSFCPCGDLERAKTIELSFETSSRGRVEGLRKSTFRFETWMP